MNQKTKKVVIDHIMRDKVSTKMEKNKELISIIMPVYNVKECILECVDSILDQTYDNFELIMVDDGSTDGSGSICDECAGKDSRIFVIHKENGGVSDARNKAIPVAKGDYICFVDPDDILAPTYLQRLYETMAESGAELVACNYYSFYDGDKIPTDIGEGKHETLIITEKEMEDEAFASEYTVKMVIPINKMYKRGIFDKIKFPFGKIHEDAYMYHHLLHEVQKIVFISDTLYYYRLRKNSITNSCFKIKELEDSMGAVIDRIDFYHGLGKQRLTDIAIDGYLYFLWRNIDLMKKDGINDYKELIKPYIKIFRKKIRYLKVSKAYPLKKLLRMYYIAYLKADY